MCPRNCLRQLESQTNAAVDCLFGFTGLPYDDGSETYRTVTRPYDPVTGRWNQPDWIIQLGGQTNLYAYCGNSPTNATDPTGTNAVLDALNKIFGVPAELFNDVIAKAVNAVVAAKIAADIRAGDPPSINGLEVSLPLGTLWGMPVSTKVTLSGTVTPLGQGKYRVHWDISNTVKQSDLHIDLQGALSQALAAPKALGNAIKDGARLLTDKMKHPTAKSGPLRDESVTGDMKLSVMMGTTQIAHLEVDATGDKHIKAELKLDVSPSQLPSLGDLANIVKLPKLPTSMKDLKKISLPDLLRQTKLNLPVSASYNISVHYTGVYGG